jgi:TldD protein
MSGMMDDWAAQALDTAAVRGASYADARLVDSRHRELSTKNGRVGTLAEGESQGLGVRVIADGAWGFASTDRLSRRGVEACAAEAVAIAKASALAKRHDVVLAPEQAYVDTWQSPYVKDPFRVPVERQMGLLLEADGEMRKVEGVTIAETSMTFHRFEQLFVSTIGSRIHQLKMQSGAGIVASCFAGGEFQKRSYPNSFGGQHALRGYELVEELDLTGHARRVGEEVVALHKAPQCPEGVRTILLDSSQVGLQIHESIGHPIELDRVLGTEANFAGLSFLTIDKLNTLRYASPHVTVVADARLEHGPGLGTFGYDDEGVPAQRTEIIRAGEFTGYLTSRETAAAVGQSRSNGTMRAESWNRLPLIRMTNVSLLPGPWRLEDLIADSDDAIYMETNRSWSIDDRRYHFQFGTEIGWEIQGGKKVRMLKNPSYSGITTEFWNACDAVCSRDHWTLWGTPNCGKGQPMQTMGTGHGASPARFRNVRVGVAFSR